MKFDLLYECNETFDQYKYKDTPIMSMQLLENWYLAAYMSVHRQKALIHFNYYETSSTNYFKIKWPLQLVVKRSIVKN